MHCASNYGMNMPCMLHPYRTTNTPRSIERGVFVVRYLVVMIVKVTHDVGVGFISVVSSPVELT